MYQVLQGGCNMGRAALLHADFLPWHACLKPWCFLRSTDMQLRVWCEDSVRYSCCRMQPQLAARMCRDAIDLTLISPRNYFLYTCAALRP